MFLKFNLTPLPRNFSLAGGAFGGFDVVGFDIEADAVDEEGFAFGTEGFFSFMSRDIANVNVM